MTATSTPTAARQETASIRGGMLAAICLALIAMAGFAVVLGALPDVTSGIIPAGSVVWAEPLGVSAAWRLDGLAMLFSLLITGFAVLIAVYSARYLRDHRHLGRFILYLGLFATAMLGLVLSDDLILLFVFWEMTSLASFLLIGFSHDKPVARRNAWQALLVTGAGGLALLAGLVLLGIAAGTTRISEIVMVEGLGDHPLYPAILTLILLGAFTKSAQVPFHFWLPGAMAAPTPVSAYLHSATMVKAGVYLLARLHPALSGTEAWTWSLSLGGGATMVLAACLALRQTDLKLALAQTSVMALGVLVMFLGAEATVAVAAAMTFLVVHALYKASLFLIVGNIEHATGTREIAKMGGLWRTMPATAFAAVLAAGSMAGFPPFLGFVGKELKYEGALAIADEPVLLAGAAVFANALMVTLALVIILRAVFGKARETPRKPREVPVAMWVPPVVLASAGLACGIAPGLVGDALVQPAVTSVLGRPEVVKLKLWHGVNVPLVLSFVTVGLGVLGFVLHRYVQKGFGAIPVVYDAGWDRLMTAIQKTFAAITDALTPASHGKTLGVTIVVLISVPVVGLVATGGLGELNFGGGASLVAWAAGLLTVSGALMTGMAVRRMTAIAGLGAVGTGTAMLFVLMGAPDVAITQLLVDVLLIVLIASAMLRLPELTPRRARPLGHAALSIGVGVAVTLLALVVFSQPFTSPASDAMLTMAVPEAKGRNVVNVILVDFRALDTFGEIVVVAAAALGAVALIRGRRQLTGGSSQ